MASKTAANVDDERTAREIWRMHEAGCKPLQISQELEIDRMLVRDVLTGRRLGPPVSERSAAVSSRCPFCGKRVLSLPCLACEIERGQEQERKAAPRQENKAEPAFSLSPVPRIRMLGRMPKPAKLATASMARIKNALICSECGARRMETASGLVCPRGHGKLHLRPDPLDVRSYHFTIKIEKLPKASRVPGSKSVVEVDGKTGYWKRIPKSRVSRTTIQVACENQIWNVDPHSNPRFRRNGRS